MMWLMFGSLIVVNPHYLLRGERKLSINVRRLLIGLTTHSAEHPTCQKATYVASSWWTCAISPITPSQLRGWAACCPQKAPNGAPSPQIHPTDVFTFIFPHF